MKKCDDFHIRCRQANRRIRVMFSMQFCEAMGITFGLCVSKEDENDTLQNFARESKYGQVIHSKMKLRGLDHRLIRKDDFKEK